MDLEGRRHEIDGRSAGGYLFSDGFTVYDGGAAAEDDGWRGSTEDSALNPRLKGDWSGKSVIEQNTCYRMQRGSSQRCEGWKSRADEETEWGDS